MKKLEVKLTVQEAKKLKELKSKGATLKIRQRAGAVYLRYLNKSIPEIMNAVDISNKSVSKHVKQYLLKGMDYITENNYKGNVSELNNYETIIINDFTETPPNTINEAIERIEKLTGLRRSWTAVKRFLKKRDFLTERQKAFPKEPTKKNNSYSWIQS